MGNKTLAALNLINLQITSDYSKSIAANHAASTEPGLKPFGDDGLTFADLIDIINPLQHIPLISTFYRNITGDTIDPAARIAGGALFGGPIGVALAVANTISNQIDGKDIGERVLALFKGQEEGTDTARAVAANESGSSGAVATITGPGQRRGGWIVNAAYYGRDLYLAAKADAKPAVQPEHRPASVAENKHIAEPRRGGWIVNAAYRGRDSYVQKPVTPVAVPGRIDTRT